MFGLFETKLYISCRRPSAYLVQNKLLQRMACSSQEPCHPLPRDVIICDQRKATTVEVSRPQADITPTSELIEPDLAGQV